MTAQQQKSESATGADNENPARRHPPRNNATFDGTIDMTRPGQPNGLSFGRKQQPQSRNALFDRQRRRNVSKADDTSSAVAAGDSNNTTCSTIMSNEEVDDTEHCGSNDNSIEDEAHDIILDSMIVTPSSSSSRSSSPQTLVEFENDNDSLLHALHLWWKSVEALSASRELHTLLGNTGHLMGTVTHQSMQVVLLPITVPLHLTTASTQLLVAAGHNIVSMAVQAVQQGVCMLLPSIGCSSSQVGGESSHQSHESGNGIWSVAGHVWNAPGYCMDMAAHLTLSAAGSVLQVFLPHRSSEGDSVTDGQLRDAALETPIKPNTLGGEPSSGHETFFLDRLRLDFGHHDDVSETAAADREPLRTPPSNDVRSKFLLRVNDLDLYMNDTKVCYVDMGHSSCPWNGKALDALVQRAYAMLAHHPTVRVATPQPTKPLPWTMEWKKEGTTGKLLKHLSKANLLERLHLLQRDALVWSGQDAQSKIPYFLARGIVGKPPRAFMELLWDNSRTHEYNNFCLGRESELVLQDHILYSAHCEQARGTKIVTSETRVPFTQLSVQVKCLMHARPLDSNDPDAGYVIISRSMDTGRAGVHFDNTHVDTRQRNEILWGVNVLRRVPQHPHLTDLTSLSHCNTCMVPRFLAHKIGMMGISEFFDNVRRHHD